MTIYPKTALVTGARGFIGSHLARHLSLQGWLVYGQSRESDSRVNFEGQGSIKLIATPISMAGLELVPKPIDCIFHCASSASVAKSLNMPETLGKSDLDGIYTILEFIRTKIPTAKLILLSSAAVYGNTENTTISEDTALKPISPYGLNKKLAEQICEFYSLHYSVEIKVVRLFSVYGPGLRRQFIWDAVEKIHRNIPLFSGSGTEKRDWLYIDDAVNLISFLAHTVGNSFTVVNGGTGIPKSTRDVLELLGSLINPKFEPVFDGIQRVGDPVHLVADTQKLVKLGWVPMYPLEDGLKKFLEWYASTYGQTTK